MPRVTYAPTQKVNIGVGKDDVNDFARKYNLEIEAVYDILNRHNARAVVFYSTSDYWSETETGYKLSLPHNNNVVFAVYRTDSANESTQVLTGVKQDATNVEIESVEKFDGFMLYGAMNPEKGIGYNTEDDIVGIISEIKDAAEAAAASAHEDEELVVEAIENFTEETGLATYQGQREIAEKIKELGTDVLRIDEKVSAAQEAAETATGAATTANIIKTAVLNAYGYPFTASTAASMTDTSKIYVYVGSEDGYINGNWYYNDGNDWVSGGAYNAIAYNSDKTLTVDGAAADSATVGYNINSFARAGTGMFSQGYLTNGDGHESTSSNRIRTSFLPKNIIGAKTPPSWASGYVVSCYNKDTGVFVGNWNGTTVATGSFPQITRAFYLNEIPNRETYIIRLQVFASSAITPSNASDVYFICSTDEQLSLVGKSADAFSLGGVLEDCDRRLNGAVGTINYGYSVGTEVLPRWATQTASSAAFGITRSFTTVTVTGGPISADAAVCLSGTIRRSTVSNATAWTTGITLTEGHTYCATLKCLNANAVSLLSSTSVSVYNVGTKSSIGTISTDNEKHIKYRTFTAGNVDLNIVLWLGKNSTWNDAKYEVVLQDITETPYKISEDAISSLDARVNGLHDLINYGYSADRMDVLPEQQAETDSQRIGVSRTGTRVVLNTLGINSVARIRITGGLARTVSNSTVDGWPSGITLTGGHSYRVTVYFISEGAINNIDNISLSVYKVGTHSTIASSYRDYDKKILYSEFIADETGLNLCIYLQANTVLSNAVMEITLSDTTYDADEDDDDIKEYYHEELEDTIAKVQNVKDEPCLTFMWATDIHRHSSNASGVQTFADMIKNMKKFSKSVHCDFILNTGDDTDGNVVASTTLQRAYDMTKEFMSIGVPYIKSNGNHDNNPYSTSTNLFDINQVFKAYYTLTPRNATINMAENGTDFYIDYNDLGVRFISINDNNVKTRDTYSWGETTPAWIESALNTNKTVFLSLHISPIRTQVYDGTSVRTSARNTAVLNAINTFINNGGNFIMLSGHSHLDIAFIEPFLCVMSICQRFYANNTIDYESDGIQAISGYIDVLGKPAREAGTHTEDAWTVGVYKPISNELHLIRFGAGVDRHFHITPLAAPQTLTTQLSGTITWSSSDTDVAYVYEGVVTGVGTGKCAILAKDANGNYECWIVTV